MLRPLTRVLLALAALALAPAPALAAAPAAAAVESFAPLGTAKAVRQVTVRFSEPMVALGDPRLPAPFDVDCAAEGSGRWADGRHWVYDFGDDLPAGLACRFTLRPKLATLAGAPVTGQRSFRFDTGGPAITGSLPRDGWQQIDEEQVFLLKLDAAATPESVAAHAHCVVDGLAEQVPLEVLAGEARAAVLRERAQLGYDYFEVLWKSGHSSHVRLRNRSLEQGDALLGVVRCQRRLPPGAQVRLVWSAGIATAAGIATRQDQQLAFRVRPAFTAQVECSRTNARAGCIPMQPVTVRFSAPVPSTRAAAIRLTGAAGITYAPATDETRLAPSVEQVTFAGPFPERSRLRVELPADLKDDAGRPLENAARFPLELRIDAYPPLAKFAAPFGILEAHEGGVLPVTLRNLEPALAASRLALPAQLLRLGDDPARLAEWLRRVEQAQSAQGEWTEVERDAATPAAAPQAGAEDGAADEPGSDPQHRRVWREDTGATSVFSGAGATPTAFTVAKAEGPRPAEVIGIPLREPGFYVVELESRMLGRALLGRDAVRYVSTAALVTNLAVHFKWGRESSRAWVTRLDTGAPVAGAEVVIADYCNGASRWQGRTDKDGIATIASTLGVPHSGAYCYPGSESPLLVLARSAGDFSFTLSAWSDGITPYQFSLPVGNRWQSEIYHTVLDRPLFRAGETVSMKHVLRRHELGGLAVGSGVPATRTVTIAHLGSGQTYALEAKFGADGIATGQWRIPAEARLGDYSISIADGERQRESGRFKVEQFRLPSMRATVSGAAAPLVRPASATFDLHVAYLSGGGAGGLPVKLRTVVEPRPLSFAGYGDYRFGGAPVQEGVVLTSGGGQDYDAEDGADATPSKVQVLPATLDAGGSARITVPNLPPLDSAAQLTAELEYADANGELLTTSSRVRLVPASVSLGIRREGWVASATQLRLRVVALDLDGRPRRDQPVAVSFYQAADYSFRKRLIGGFYAYETSRETKKLPASCAGRTDAQGLLTCEVAPGGSGEIIVRAESRDDAGHVAGATTSVWVVGADDWWFGGTAGDRMDLLPEKKEYEAGETARFQVRMPFRSATALVTVEREGVITSFVRRLDGHAPVVEVPIGAGYAPNVYVSVLAVRGRVARSDAPPGRSPPGGELTALVDLNKPAYRLGMAAIRVGWKPHRLDVRVLPERPTYKVRETARVAVEVRRADGTPLPAGTEVAIAAVDEALLSLAPNPSWALLEAMMGERGLEVWTSTAQLQVVGKRHYGRKAVPHGGGGGRDADRARELFASLLYWQPRVVLDAAGRASVAVPLNDSLSSFRLVAVASGGRDLFGTGSAVINTTQDLILLAGVPPLVREGDRYAATFTVRNTTQRALGADVAAELVPAPATPLATQHVEVPAGASRDVVWQVSAPLDARELRWRVTAREPGGTGRDTLAVSEAVQPAWAVRTYQATIAQLGAGAAGALAVPAERPAGAVPGRGGLEVTLRARLGDGLDGVREYMRLYPYTCLEQGVSRAVALRDRALWDQWMARLPAYMDPDGLLRYFPTERLPGEDTLSAYLLALADEAGWPLAEADRDRLIAALTRFVAGGLVRGSALPTADLSIRKLAAIDALARHGAATPAMLDSLAIEPDLWPTSAVLDWLGILTRVEGIAGAEAKRRAALGILRARLNFQGTTLGFATERSDALWWLMVSGDSNANRLLLAVLALPEWREDVPRLVRGALGRQQYGHWNTTVANAWGVLAMEKFSAAFESTPVSGATAVGYGTTERRVTWPQPHGVAELALPWQPGRATLAVSHDGSGRPWALVRATAALPLRAPLSSGFKVARSVTAVEQHAPGRYTRGDVVRVRLELEAQSDMSWVVVDDPVPAGATIQGSGLGGQSALLAGGERRAGDAWLAFEERRFDALRAYYRFVPKGRWTVEYTVRINNPGTFQLPATRVEAMYAPEMYGEVPNPPLGVDAPP